MTDPAFEVVQKGKAQFLIWRVENMKVKAVPKQQYGQFYTGDSYIILSIKESEGSMDAHIHFWLGKGTSQDEADVAAIKSVELDNELGGYPVQHREVQGSESKLFLSYFKNGISVV